MSKVLGMAGLFCLGLVMPVVVWGQAQSAGTAQSGWWDQHRAVSEAEPPSDEQSLGEPVDAASVDAMNQEQFSSSLVVAPGEIADFDCVEVRAFEVTVGLIGSKEDARAAQIPVEALRDIQRRVAGYIPEKARGLRSTLLQEGWPACPDPAKALVLGGRVADYKRGNQALRYFVGFGAGAQKFAVEVWMMRKTDGALVARGEVVDRKVGGWIGGQADKGMDDFAEKVAGFVRDSLKRR
ncbi:MAG: DUF4410 domain-containing protein [Luteimonas sp.]|nr:DUF4410 domain-containing protein [Luteimonas sp.]